MHALNLEIRIIKASQFNTSWYNYTTIPANSTWSCIRVHDSWSPLMYRRTSILLKSQDSIFNFLFPMLYSDFCPVHCSHYNTSILLIKITKRLFKHPFYRFYSPYYSTLKYLSQSLHPHLHVTCTDFCPNLHPLY